MSVIDALRHRLRVVFQRERVAREMEAEVRFHLELEREHLGAANGDAGAIRRRFGNILSVGEERRKESGLARLDPVLQDLSYSVRQLRRAPAFAAGVVGTLALGIGASTTMFSIIDHVMLRAPSGIVAADRVVQVRFWKTGRDGVRDSVASQSFPSFEEFRGMRDLFAAVAAVRGPLDVPVDLGPQASTARASIVAGDYFGTLGVRAEQGRFFSADEVSKYSTASVAVISYAYWRRRFGGDARAVGMTLTVAGGRYTIVGIAPPDFAGHTLSASDLWIPMAVAPSLRFGGPEWATMRGAFWLRVIARLQPSVSRDRALNAIAHRWTAWNFDPSQHLAAPTPYFASLTPSQNQGQPEFRVARLVGGISLLLFLIVCANVANLLIARSVTRRREIAVRLALGASRHRLTRLMLMDVFVLAIASAAVALAIAHWGTPIIRAILLGDGATIDWHIDARVIGFTLALSLVATLLAGLGPALRATRTVLADDLKLGARSGSIHGSRMRTFLIVIQGALSTALMAGTGMFAMSLHRIEAQHFGLDLDHVAVVDFQAQRVGLSDRDVAAIYADMHARATGVPGVRSASLTVGIPFAGQYALPIALPGLDSIPGIRGGEGPYIYGVTPDFFRTIGTRLIAGRGLLESDNATAPRVAVVSAEMARRLWPDESAVGKCFHYVLANEPPTCIRVVGIAENARRQRLAEAAPALQYYVPIPQAPAQLAEPVLIVRTDGAPGTIGRLRRALATVRPALPFIGITTLSEMVGRELRPWRLGSAMFGLFGGLALVVAAIGMYTVTRFGVSQRAREMGIRIALGAGRGRIVRLVAGDALVPAAIACLVGALIVLTAGRFVQALLFETSARDPLIIGTIALVLLACAAVASLAPAWSASRLDPTRTLAAD